ncbi:hypothetical protein [Nocardioides sp. GY 10113]|uniref:hypothetical protein n=1 Tax=Nocardioides sp. GY 10113 TaxID=2569761 RepID=UPI00197CF4B1|nr:hypothetical protein [Nocardioides sp. GY 10113]
MTSTPPPVPTGEPGPPPLPGADPAVPLEVTETLAANETVPHGEVGRSEDAAPLSAVCPTCGSQTFYAPGTMLLRCESCGSEREIAPTTDTIDELDFEEWLASNQHTTVAGVAGHELSCSQCGASCITTDLASACQFCGGALVAHDVPAGLVVPEAVIPFGVDGKEAREAFRTWVSSRWFAPNRLKKVGDTEALRGTYLPHWTFDAQTDSDYTGQRGDYYYTTETRTVSDGKGGTRTETYQQRHTAWRPAAGRVARFFDDVVVPGSHALDPAMVDKAGPWELSRAVPYQPEFLTGYSAVRYDVDPAAGSEQARQKMVEVIKDDVRRDIGGDEQRISTLGVIYTQATFKLMLMPLWIATYLYAGKTWQVMVNANTGEVVGRRPYSWVKITAAVVAAVLLLLVILVIWSSSSSG